MSDDHDDDTSLVDASDRQPPTYANCQYYD